MHAIYSLAGLFRRMNDDKAKRARMHTHASPRQVNGYDTYYRVPPGRRPRELACYGSAVLRHLLINMTQKGSGKRRIIGIAWLFARQFQTKGAEPPWNPQMYKYFVGALPPLPLSRQRLPRSCCGRSRGALSAPVWRGFGLRVS